LAETASLLTSPPIQSRFVRPVRGPATSKHLRPTIDPADPCARRRAGRVRSPRPTSLTLARYSPPNERQLGQSGCNDRHRGVPGRCISDTSATPLFSFCRGPVRARLPSTCLRRFPKPLAGLLRPIITIQT